MELDLGGNASIDEPTEDEVRFYLRYMDVTSPFVVLWNDDGEFIQTLGSPLGYRVEYRGVEEVPQYWVDDLDYGATLSLFLAFYRGDETYKTAQDWQEIREPSIWHKPWSAPVVLILIILLLLGLAWQVYSTFW